MYTDHLFIPNARIFCTWACVNEGVREGSQQRNIPGDVPSSLLHQRTLNQDDSSKLRFHIKIKRSTGGSVTYPQHVSLALASSPSQPHDRRTVSTAAEPTREHHHHPSAHERCGCTCGPSERSRSRQFTHRTSLPIPHFARGGMDNQRQESVG